MKKAIIIFITMVIPLFCFTQTIENLDYISTFNDGLAAIKKNNQWAFINTAGDLVVDFRDDFVLPSNSDSEYPIFKENRCLIVKEKEGISYFGYIDKTGKVITEPQFLNASNYYNNIAIVLKLVKNEVGTNDLLGKNAVSYQYFEVSIDPNGKVLDYLTVEGVNLTLDKEFLQGPPQITHKHISENVFAVLNENKTWTVKKITN